MNDTYSNQYLFRYSKMFFSVGKFKMSSSLIQLDTTSQVIYEPNFLKVSDKLREHLTNLPWKTVTRYRKGGGKYQLPRKQQCMQDVDANPRLYQQPPNLEWSEEVSELKLHLENYLSARLERKVYFDYVLMNLYLNGSSYMSWHSDGEAEEEGLNIIASISIGAERLFKLKTKPSHNIDSFLFPLKHDLSMTDGTLIAMTGDTQLGWIHSVPKTKKPKGPRINLTFRLSKNIH
jgi:alkylated DNA repair dioxygenase AlkB